MKKVLKMVAVAAAALMIAGCGQRVTVDNAQVGKVMDEHGFQEDVITTSTFRLNACWWPGAVCDRLVLLDVSDRSVTENFDLFMPEDRLSMTFGLGVTIGIKEGGINELFTKIPPSGEGRHRQISVDRAYETYAQRIIRAETRTFLTQYSIGEISSNRDVIGAQLFKHLKEQVEAQTPFSVRYAGLDDVDYPGIIVKAQERAAERREAIQQEEAQLEIARVQFKRKLEEEQLQRRVDVEKAEAESEVNLILAKSVTPDYVTYRQLKALDQISQSDNTKFIPLEMLSSMSGQVMIGNEAH